MEGAPEAINGEAMKEELEKLQEGLAVKEFHLWSLSKGKYVMTAHLEVNGDSQNILEEATKVVNGYGIKNATL